MIAPYTLIAEMLPRRMPFTGRSMRAAWMGDVYYVWSYETVIATFDRRTGEVWLNENKYSSTTSHHQGMVRRAWNLEKGKVKR